MIEFLDLIGFNENFENQYNLNFIFISNLKNIFSVLNFTVDWCTLCFRTYYPKGHPSPSVRMFEYAKLLMLQHNQESLPVLRKVCCFQFMQPLCLLFGSFPDFIGLFSFFCKTIFRSFYSYVLRRFVFLYIIRSFLDYQYLLCKFPHQFIFPTFPLSKKITLNQHF